MTIEYNHLKEMDELKDALVVKEELDAMRESLRLMANSGKQTKDGVALLTPSEELDLLKGELNQAKIDKGVAVAMHRMAKDEIDTLKVQLTRAKEGVG